MLAFAPDAISATFACLLRRFFHLGIAAVGGGQFFQNPHRIEPRPAPSALNIGFALIYDIGSHEVVAFDVLKHFPWADQGALIGGSGLKLYRQFYDAVFIIILHRTVSRSIVIGPPFASSRAADSASS